MPGQWPDCGQANRAHYHHGSSPDLRPQVRTSTYVRDSTCDRTPYQDCYGNNAPDHPESGTEDFHTGTQSSRNGNWQRCQGAREETIQDTKGYIVSKIAYGNPRVYQNAARHCRSDKNLERSEAVGSGGQN